MPNQPPVTFKMPLPATVNSPSEAMPPKLSPTMNPSPVLLTVPFWMINRLNGVTEADWYMRAMTSQLFTVNVPPLVTIMLPAPPPLPGQASLTLGTVLLTIAVPPLLTLPMAQPPEVFGTPPFQLAESFHPPTPAVQSLALEVEIIKAPAKMARTSGLLNLDRGFFIIGVFRCSRR